jgi:hypothetical protein
MRSLQRRRPGELPPSGALGLVASQDSERCQAVEDLLDVALVRAPERASDLLHRPGGRGLGGEVAERQIWSASFFVHGAAAAGCEAACSGSSVAKSRSRVAALKPVGFWNSGRSQRTMSRLSSAAHSAFRTTRHQRSFFAEPSPLWGGSI